MQSQKQAKSDASAPDATRLIAACRELGECLGKVIAEVTSLQQQRSAEAMSPAPPTTADQLDRKTAAAYLGISVATLDRLRTRGDVPSIRISERKVRYRREDLDYVLAQALVRVRRR